MFDGNTCKRIDEFLATSGAAPGFLSGHAASVRLNESEVYGLLDAIGIARCPAEILQREADEKVRASWAGAALKLVDARGRLLLKVVGREILHKSDVGGVRVVKLGDQRTGEAILREVDLLWNDVAEKGQGNHAEGVLAGAFVPHTANQPGQEILLSLRQDPAFGPCIVVGIGGTLTEWYGAGTGGASTLVFPADGLVADAVRDSLLAHPFLSLLCQSSRLYPEAPTRTEELVDAVLKLAQLGEYCSAGGASDWTLEEIEINPLVVSEGQLVALDGVGLVSRRRESTLPRPLARVRKLLQPNSAVVIGASASGPNPGRIILENLKRAEGVARNRLYAVHQRESEIGGVPCYASIDLLPEKCDLAVVAIPAQGALDAITALVEQDRAESIILIPGGFAEAGETDLARSIEAALIQGHSRDGGGPVLVGGNCLGIVSRENYNTFFLPEYKLPFRPGQGENLAVVSQSGAYLVTFASNYDGLIHPRASISFGNQMDLTVSDFLEHFLTVDEVDVIACYIEGFRAGDGGRFVRLAHRARQLGKKVIVFKAGKTPLGAQAAASHTASLAGDYAVAEACLRSAGISVADTLSRFEDLIKTFTLLGQRPVGEMRTGIISNAGFECSTVTDNMGPLRLADFDDATQAMLDDILPGFAHRTNPIDCTPMTGTDAFAESCRAILESASVDVAILASVPVTPALNNLPADPGGAHRENLENEGSQPKRMVEILRASAKPAVVVVDSGSIYDPMCRLIEAAGIPVFRKIDRAARALGAYCLAEGASE